MKKDKAVNRILGHALTRELNIDETGAVKGGDGGESLIANPKTSHSRDGGSGNTWTDTTWDDYYA